MSEPLPASINFDLHEIARLCRVSNGQGGHPIVGVKRIVIDADSAVARPVLAFVEFDGLSYEYEVDCAPFMDDPTVVLARTTTPPTKVGGEPEPGWYFVLPGGAYVRYNGGPITISGAIGHIETVGASIALEEVFPTQRRAPDSANQESAWLVETQDGLTQRTCYLSVTPTGFRWVEEPHLALRFARRFDAEGVLPSVRASQSNPQTPVHAREHIWCAASSD